MTHLLTFLGILGGIALLFVWVFTLITVYADNVAFEDMTLWEKCCTVGFLLAFVTFVLAVIGAMGYNLWVATS